MLPVGTTELAEAAELAAVAVYVTDCPTTDGLADEARVVVEDP